MLSPISALVVDDHALLRKELRRMLDDDPEIVVVGEAGNGLEALQLVQRLAPQVVVMDLEMPVMDGIQATREILIRAPNTVVLMVSNDAYEGCVRRAFEVGVSAYLLKNAADFDLTAAIKAVASGRSVLGGVTCPA